MIKIDKNILMERIFHMDIKTTSSNVRINRNDIQKEEDFSTHNRLTNFWPLSEEELNKEIEKGYADMQAGRIKNAKKVFDDIRKDYNIRYGSRSI